MQIKNTNFCESFYLDSYVFISQKKKSLKILFHNANKVNLPSSCRISFFLLSSCMYLSTQSHDLVLFISVFSFLFYSFFVEVLSVQSVQFKFYFVLSLVSHFPKIAISQIAVSVMPPSPIIMRGLILEIYLGDTLLWGS